MVRLLFRVTTHHNWEELHETINDHEQHYAVLVQSDDCIKQWRYTGILNFIIMH